MTDTSKVLIRHARDQDLPAVQEIDEAAFASFGTAEKPETFRQRLTVFPDGFVTLVADNEIAGFGCSEKWLSEREPGRDENPAVTHQPDGRVLCITALAVKQKFRGRGYRLLLLDKMLEIAHREGCRKIMVKTAHDQDLYQTRGFQSAQQRTQGGNVMSLDIVSYGSKA